MCKEMKVKDVKNLEVNNYPHGFSMLRGSDGRWYLEQGNWAWSIEDELARYDGWRHWHKRSLDEDGREVCERLTRQEVADILNECAAEYFEEET